jgi:hypothetical protein
MKRENGQLKDEEVIFTNEDVEKGLVTKYVTVHVKIHLNTLESFIFEASVALD